MRFFSYITKVQFRLHYFNKFKIKNGCLRQQYIRGLSLPSYRLGNPPHPHHPGGSSSFFLCFSVEEGLKWEAHIIYGCVHVPIGLIQVMLIARNIDWFLDQTEGRNSHPYVVMQRSKKIFQKNEIESSDRKRRMMIAFYNAVMSQLLMFDMYTDFIFVAITNTDPEFESFTVASATILSGFLFCRYFMLFSSMVIFFTKREGIKGWTKLSLLVTLELLDYDLFRRFQGVYPEFVALELKMLAYMARYSTTRKWQISQSRTMSM